MIAVHWLTVLLLVVGVGAVLWRTQTELRAWRALLLDLHRWAGVALFALSCIRLALRLRGPARPARPRGGRVSLYAFSNSDLERILF